MAFLGIVLAYFYIPEDMPKPSIETSDQVSMTSFSFILKLFSPLPVFRILRYFEVLFSVSHSRAISAWIISSGELI